MLAGSIAFSEITNMRFSKSEIQDIEITIAVFLRGLAKG
ncbi:hypothetical protein DESC_810002 [Desulfosarcina cetonica]|nr:hypothetical protein DESC_810002 [Desulfosarcina cetonica]